MNVNWAKMYHRIPQVKKDKKIDTKRLAEDKDIQDQYQQYIVDQIYENKQEMTNDNQEQPHRWEKIKKIIQKAAETNIGFKNKEMKGQVKDEQLEQMSNAQKKLRLQIESCEKRK